MSTLVHSLSLQNPHQHSHDHHTNSLSIVGHLPKTRSLSPSKPQTNSNNSTNNNNNKGFWSSALALFGIGAVDINIGRNNNSGIDKISNQSFSNNNNTTTYDNDPTSTSKVSIRSVRSVLPVPPPPPPPPTLTAKLTASSTLSPTPPPPSQIKVPKIPVHDYPEWSYRPSVTTDVKRYCQVSDRRPLPVSTTSANINNNHSVPKMSPEKESLSASNTCDASVSSVGSVLRQRGLIEQYFSEYKDIHGFRELSYKNGPEGRPRFACCSLCDPKSWIFDGSEYDPYMTCLYAEKDGCIPSSVVTKLPKFIIPWRYKNRKTGEISWKIYHLHKDKIHGAENETIIVNPYKDSKLRAVMEYVSKNFKKYSMGSKLVEFLLKVVQETMGDYGLPGGPSSAEADEKIYQKMLSQGHNFMLLCQVPIGVCRHKALLFKILADIVNLNCAVITGYSTAGRHQWNIITLPTKGDFLIDPTSCHFTWAKPGSLRTKGYKILQDDSLGHAGFTLKHMHDQRH